MQNVHIPPAFLCSGTDNTPLPSSEQDKKEKTV